MELNFNQADFLMHCIDLYCNDFNGDTACFTDTEGSEIMMDFQQIKDLYLRIQEHKFTDR
jgi:hypothetical protein